VSESAEKYLLWFLKHEDRIDTVDLNVTVYQRPHSIVVADCDGKLKLAH
jgi:hypothetical protein